MTQEYPLLLKRIQALLIDFLLILVSMVLLSQLFSFIKEIPDGLRMGAFVAIFFLYDPFLTAAFGGTLGHRIVGIRVRKASAENENIHFFGALLRFVCKSFLGWISLLTVTGNQRKRAIHDMVSGSVVTFHKPIARMQPVSPETLS